MGPSRPRKRSPPTLERTNTGSGNMFPRLSHIPSPTHPSHTLKSAFPLILPQSQDRFPQQLTMKYELGDCTRRWSLCFLASASALGLRRSTKSCAGWEGRCR